MKIQYILKPNLKQLKYLISHNTVQIDVFRKMVLSSDLGLELKFLTRDCRLNLTHE